MPLDPFGTGLLFGTTLGAVSVELLRRPVINAARRLAAKLVPAPVLPPMKSNQTSVEEVAAAIEQKLAGRFDALSERIAQHERVKASGFSGCDRLMPDIPIPPAREDAPVAKSAAFGFQKPPAPKTWRDDPELFALARDVAQGLSSFGMAQKKAEAATLAAMDAVAKPGVSFDDVFKIAVGNGGKK